MNHYGQIITACHHQPSSKMPFKWHFAGRLIMAYFYMFTWNARESLNAILKMDIDRKPKKLIEILYGTVKCQFLDFKAALYGLGKLSLN